MKTFEMVFADARGQIYNFPGLMPAGMKTTRFFEIPEHLWQELPAHSELFMLPGRVPFGYDPEACEFLPLLSDPYSGGNQPVFPVAAFIPPGHTLTHNTAFEERDDAPLLPLFAYGACAFSEGKFYVAAVRVDSSVKHDERRLDAGEIKKGIAAYTQMFPKNRLVPHLANCATVNACANAKNFFLGRFEAPIPSSPVCNAQCQGCISLQPEGDIPPTQPRIRFTPEPEEIAELVLHHFEREEDPIVSFGQGCEGEPSLSGETIEKAIRLIRQKTSKGLININSNASRPEAIARLMDAGLNSMRASLNSVREPYYSRYYQPKNYSLAEVEKSIDAVKAGGGFVSLNYLSMPGFTDSGSEFEALKRFVAQHRIDMIQWRNLNYDPLQYFTDIQYSGMRQDCLGMENIIPQIKKEFPHLLTGYFNPHKSHLGAR